MSKHSRLPKAVLALDDGTLFYGDGFGALASQENPALGEVVFNTSMYGYQEILSDPSYAGQMITFTCPHIGNVGCNHDDIESSKLHAASVIIRDLSLTSSNFRAQTDLSSYLADAGVMGIAGIDTRSLVSHIRDRGARIGALAANVNNVSNLVEQARHWSYEATDYVAQVTCSEPYQWNGLPWALANGYRKLSDSKVYSRPHVVAIDCGVKNNILRLLLEVGFRVTVVPATSKLPEIERLNPDGIFLSNGPGDPSRLPYLVNTVEELIGRFPIFGICLGHQILGQALGGKTFKLKFGHRGGNHPVRDEKTGKVEITVQNHGYAIDRDSLPDDVALSHVNLNDQTVEGIVLPEARAFSVQYHPESSPGPHDAGYLFKRFFDLVVNPKEDSLVN